MKNKSNKLNVTKWLNGAVITVVLTACGSQSSSDEDIQLETAQVEETTTASVENTATYEPEIALLYTAAGSSTELYVEPQFNFDTHKTLNIEFQISDVEGKPLNNTMVFLSSIGDEVVALDDPNIANKSLLSVLKTDAAGNITKAIEVNQTVTNLLIEIDSLGIENEHIITIPNDGLVFANL